MVMQVFFKKTCKYKYEIWRVIGSYCVYINSSAEDPFDEAVRQWHHHGDQYGDYDARGEGEERYLPSGALSYER